MLSSQVYKQRRAKLMKQMKEGACLIFSAPVVKRNNDVEYDYRQDSNFYYLTGFEEPEAALLLLPKAKKDKIILFCRPKDKAQEIWVGHREGVAGAKKNFGADKAHPIATLHKQLSTYLQGSKVLYYSLGSQKYCDALVTRQLNHLRAQVRSGMSYPTEIKDPVGFISEMRLFKSKEEIDALKEATQISSEGHEMAMRMTVPGINEYEIDATLQYCFRSSGSVRLGYPNIVASGVNATTLHYTKNNRKMKSGDLLLIDAGTEADYFTADITRTFPVNGKFTKEQAAIYSIVLKAQKAAIHHVKPGVTFQSVHNVAVRKLSEGLKSLGVLKGTLKQIIEKESYSRFYMHRTSHWLGMDVHDCGAYQINGKSRKLEPGMVLTVEPGLYFRKDEKGYPAKYRGIGIRIEDDILVTRSGNQVLSEAAPKEIKDIEAIVGKGIEL